MPKGQDTTVYEATIGVTVGLLVLLVGGIFIYCFATKIMKRDQVAAPKNIEMGVAANPKYKSVRVSQTYDLMPHGPVRQKNYGAGPPEALFYGAGPPEAPKYDVVPEKHQYGPAPQGEEPATKQLYGPAPPIQTI